MHLNDLCKATHICKSGTSYQATLSKDELCLRIEDTATDIVAHGPYDNIDHCADFISDCVIDGTVRNKKLRFHSTEVAKDFCSFPIVHRLIRDGARCSLGPGFRKGLNLVRREPGRNKCTAVTLAIELNMLQKDIENAL